MLHEGLNLKLKQKGNILGIIIIKKVKSEQSFTSQDESDPSIITEFRFLEKTKAWHVVFEGLGGEKCVKEEIPYTLCPM